MLQHLWPGTLAGLIALLATLLLTPLVRALAIRRGWVARPLEDRWGRRVTARLGGLAMFGGFLATALLWLPGDSTLIRVLPGVCLVFALGLLDDVRRLAPYTKLLGQLVIGCLVILSGVRIELIQWTWLSIPLSVLWFVAVMNAFNLLDNMDGLAAGIGAIAAGFCAFHAALAQQWSAVGLSLILGGTCLGFLRSNFPPAKIYMGDSGSHFLGLSLAMLAILGTWHRSTQLVSVLAVPVLVLAVPIFDMCFVTIQRLLHRQHPFTGGTDHVSHRLAILGLTERQTVLALYGVSAGLGFLSIISAGLRPLAVVVVWVVMASALLLIGRYLARVNVYRLEPQQVTGAVPVKAVTRIETMLLHKRRLLEILVDFALLSSAYVIAHLLRFEGVLTYEYQQRVLQSLPVLLVIKVACFAGFGLYRGVWRYLGLTDIIQIFKAVTLSSVLFSLGLLYLWRFAGYSRAVLIIDWMLTFLAVGGSRVVERLLDEWITGAAEQGVPVVIVGAGDTGERVLRWLRYDGRGKYRLVGFLDDDVRKHGNLIRGVPVLGGLTLLAELCRQRRALEVLVAINDPPGELLEEIRRVCEPRGVPWKVVTAGVTETA